MRTIGCLLLALLTLGWLACQWPIGESDVISAAPELRLGYGGQSTAGLAIPADRLAIEVSTTWRRTTDGWEHPTWWLPKTEPPRPRLHPLVVGLLHLLVSLFALVAFSPFPGGESGRGGVPEESPEGASDATAGKPAR